MEEQAHQRKIGQDCWVVLSSHLRSEFEFKENPLNLVLGFCPAMFSYLGVGMKKTERVY